MVAMIMGDEFLAHTFSLARYLSTASLTTHARDTFLFRAIRSSVLYASGSFSCGQDHQVGKSCAACAVAEGRTGHIVGCLNHETLGRHQFFQYRRNLVTGVAVGAVQYQSLTADLPGYVCREGLQLSLPGNGSNIGS